MTELPRTLRSLLVTLVCLLAFLAPNAASPTAWADAEEQLAQVEFTGISIPDSPAGHVVISGRLTNTSGKPLTRVQVMSWRYSPPAARTSDELATVLDSDPGDPLGARIDRFGPSFVDITTTTAPTFAAGANTSFTLTAPLSDFTFDNSPGAYLIGVHVRGSSDANAPIATIARARSLIARTPTGSKPVASVTSVVMLSSRPSADGNKIFTDDHLADELASRGRLDTLLTSAARPNVSWAIDPSLLDEITAMVDGYRLRDDKGNLTDGGGAEVAKSWLARFRQLSTDGWLLPYALPDLNAVHGPDAVRQLVPRFADLHSHAAQTTGLPTLVTTRTGALSPAALESAKRLSPKVVLATTASAAATTNDGITVLRAEPDIFAGGPGPDPAADNVRIRGRRDAQTLIAALDGRTNQVRLITSAQEATNDVADPPWQHRQTLSDLLNRHMPDGKPTLNYAAEPSQSELSLAQVDRLVRLSQQQRLLEDLVVDPTATAASANHTLARASSGWFVGQHKPFDALVATMSQELSALTDGKGVTMAVAPKVTLTAQQGTFFPATITNHLANPVQVRTVFSSDQPQRLRFPTQELTTIAPGQSVTVNVEPTALVNGSVVAHGHLETPNGLPVTADVSTTVESTNLGQAGWIIVAISGIVLIGTTTLRIRQVRARNAGSTVHE